MSGPSRRAMLGGLVAAGGWLAASRIAPALAAGEKLIVRVARPQDLETPGAGLDAEFTPNDQFFVRSHFGPAIVDEKSFRLEVGGLVRKRLSLSLAELKKLPHVTVPAVLQC